MMEQLTEESQYVFRDQYPEREATYRLFDDLSQAARSGPGFAGSFPYGDHPRERFDLFLAEALDAPLIIFFHGGYWQSLDRSRYSFVGEQLRRHGVSAALPSYPLCPDVNLRQLLGSTLSAIPVIIEELAARGRRPSKWSVAGHSAGAHIASWIASDERLSGLRAMSSCIAISGIFDLTPLRQTSLNRKLGLSAADVDLLSPDPIGKDGPRLLIAVGSEETEGFMAQSRSYLDATRLAGGMAEYLELETCNHYTVLQEIMAKRSRLMQAFLGKNDCSSES